jgi:RNA 2',3'-cyclic 3'-phosphodiesterase
VDPAPTPRPHRLFVAISPPDPVRRRLAALVAELKTSAGRAGGEVRWTPPENVHLTLQFLGGVPDARVDDVKAAVSAASAAASAAHLSLEVKGAGGFPNARRPRIVWLGIAGDVAALAHVVADLGRRLAPLGFPPEARPFSPHLTIGRAREQRGAPGLGGALAHAGEAEGFAWRVSELVVFESFLSPKGPRYEAVHRAPLGGAGRAPLGGGSP